MPLGCQQFSRCLQTRAGQILTRSLVISEKTVLPKPVQLPSIAISPKLNFVPFIAKIAIAVFVFATLLIFYQQRAQSVTILVDGHPFEMRTHRLTVETVLLQSDIQLNAQDSLSLLPNSGIAPDIPIEIELARPVQINLGQAETPITLFTHAQKPAEIFSELGIAISPADDIFVDDVLWEAQKAIPTNLPEKPNLAVPLKTAVEALRPPLIHLTLNKAMTVQMNDGGTASTFSTTAQSVGELLLAQDIPLYQGDAISPPLSAPLTPDTVISIERSVPISVKIDGQSINTRTRGKTIGDVLAQEQIVLVGQDYTRPAENSPITNGETIEIVRVTEALEIEKETTDFETIFMPDTNLEIDRQEVQQPGQQGITKTRTRVRYENGEEVFRQKEETWLAQEPADKITVYGTNIIVRTLETPDGEIEYWRKIRMLATSYSAATSGKSKDHPAYGITRTGLQAGYGVVAVDPGVISLRSNVYVPGYGAGVAGDTGGAILGKHIDLGYDEDNLKLWYRWVDVYVQTPIPRWDKIRYVLPQFPQER